MTEDATLLRRLKRALRSNSRFPINTCPYSRHVQLMGECLSSGDERYAMFEEEPEHCAISMLATVNALYKARNEIARLKGEVA